MLKLWFLNHCGHIWDKCFWWASSSDEKFCHTLNIESWDFCSNKQFFCTENIESFTSAFIIPQKFFRFIYPGKILFFLSFFPKNSIFWLNAAVQQNFSSIHPFHLISCPARSALLSCSLFCRSVALVWTLYRDVEIFLKVAFCLVEDCPDPKADLSFGAGPKRS